MKLTDILPVEQWRELETEIFERSGLNPTIYDADGGNVTGTGTRNELCHKILTDPRGQASICSVSFQQLTRQAKKTCKPVVGACRSGQAKIVVPIFVGVTFVGAAGGCGLIPEGGKVDSLLVGQTLGLDSGQVKKLSEQIPGIRRKTAQDTADYIRDRIDGIISIYMQIQNTKTH
jgi:hypothetical protein